MCGSARLLPGPSPYDAILQNAAYGRGVPMWGAESSTPAGTHWPQPFPYHTKLERARALMAESDYPDGFEVPLSFDLGQADWAESTALLIQEALGQIGIKVTLDRIPGANWRTRALVDKQLPLHLENFGGWLNTPCYYFFWAYIEGNLFNSSNYHSDEIAQLVDDTLFMAMDDPDYAPKIRRMIEIAFEDVPRIPLYQPALNVAMGPNLDGYTFWHHRQLDTRVLQTA